ARAWQQDPDSCQLSVPISGLTPPSEGSLAVRSGLTLSEWVPTLAGAAQHGGRPPFAAAPTPHRAPLRPRGAGGACGCAGQRLDVHGGGRGRGTERRPPGGDGEAAVGEGGRVRHDPRDRQLVTGPERCPG